ncbi:MAG: tetratricopeptide repeat protein [Bacteroidales bacterium]
MYRLILIFILSLCFLQETAAQQEGSFSRFDGESYRFYLEEKWDSLIHTGKEALDEGIDYYYLRMRLGIACYSKKNYRRAAQHFSRAIELNRQDPVALEYLYYSRLYAGQQQQAELVRKQFRGDLALKLPPPKPAFFDQAGAEYSFCRGLTDEFINHPLEYFSGIEPGTQYLTRWYSNVSLSVTNSLSPGISLTHAYTFLNKRNIYYYADGTGFFTVTEQQLRQHQYYLSPRFTTRSGFQIIPVFHLVRVRYQVPGEGSTGYQGGSVFPLEFTERNDFLTGLALSGETGMVDWHLEGYYTGLNDARQIQNRIGITWYPLGNLNFYGGGYVNSLVAPGSGEGILEVIPELLLGFSIREKIWFDLHAAAGEMKNYAENYGAILYNSFSEVVEKKVRFSLSVPVTQKGSILYLGGQWAGYRSEFSSSLSGQTEPLNPLTYQTITIYGGLSWKF